MNSVQATFLALETLKSPKREAARRGKPVEDLLPFWKGERRMAKKSPEGKTIKVTLVRSPIGYPVPQKATVRALGCIA